MMTVLVAVMVVPAPTPTMIAEVTPAAVPIRYRRQTHRSRKIGPIESADSGLRHLADRLSPPLMTEELVMRMLSQL